MRCAVLFTVSAALIGCGGGVASVEPAEPVTTVSTADTVPVTPSLAEFETAELTGHLLEVSGYRYVDIADDERSAEIAALPEWVTAASFHDIVDCASAAEVGRLVLLVMPPDSPALAAGRSRALATQMLGTGGVRRETFSGHVVWVAIDPLHPTRPVQYLWVRHGTVGGVGAADEAVAERFLGGYFRVPYFGSENPILGARVVDVAGFAFVDASDRTIEVDAVAGVALGATGSLHYVFDDTHMFAALVMAGPVAATQPDDVADLVTAWIVESYGSQAVAELETLGPLHLDHVHVVHLRCPVGDMHLFAWAWPETHVVAWLMASDSDLAEAFLQVFLVAQPAEGGATAAV